MARRTQDTSSDDDTPEVVSRSTSEADAKRSQRALRDVEAAEKARRKARNREKDQKLKERARLTKGGKTGEKSTRVRFAAQAFDEEDDGDDDVEARMLRAMREAGDEMGCDDGHGDGEGGGSKVFGKSAGSGDDDMASDSDASFAPDEDDAEMSFEGASSTDSEALSDDEEMAPIRATLQKPGRKADYLADDLFTAAFSAQSSKPAPQKEGQTVQQQTVEKRRRRSGASPKDLVIGGRTIRTLLKPLDARSQASARSIPSAGASKFLDRSLVMTGKRAILKAKKRGWERRTANIGVMKYQGAPHGFTRSAR